jgi:hypothetical protein
VRAVGHETGGTGALVGAEDCGLWINAQHLRNQRGRRPDATSDV